MKSLLSLFFILISLPTMACLNFSGKYRDNNLPPGFEYFEIIQNSCTEIRFDYGLGDIKDYLADGQVHEVSTTNIEDRGQVIGVRKNYYQSAILDKGLVIIEANLDQYNDGREELYRSSTQYSILPSGDLLLAISSDGDVRFEVNRRVK